MNEPDDATRVAIEGVLSGFARGLTSKGTVEPLEARRAVATSALSVIAREDGVDAAADLLRELVEVGELDDG